jgi:hypothetical protein
MRRNGVGVMREMRVEILEGGELAMGGIRRQRPIGRDMLCGRGEKERVYKVMGFDLHSQRLYI